MVSGIKLRAVRNALELKLRRCKGEALQQFLAALMAKLHGEGFVPGGTDYSLGDLKCDGLLADPLTIFACYGPVNAGDHATDSSMRKAVAKVASDFEGAKAHWPDMRVWVFVTNYLDTPMQIIHEILRLRKENPDREIRLFGRKQFEDAVLALDEDAAEELLGSAATEADFRSLQPAEIVAVTRAVMDRPAAALADDAGPVVVPADKLEFNSLGGAHKDSLIQAFENAKDVARIVKDHPNPFLEGELAAIYKAKYVELDCQGLEPGDVLDELYEFTLAGERPTAPRQVAVWSMLAYFFEMCTIFRDRPRSGEPVGDAA